MENKKRNKKRKKQSKKSAKSVNLLDKRVIYLNGDIDEYNSKEIVESLMKLDMCSHEDITMYINSGGGLVSDGFAIYDAMNMIKSDVSTVCIGKCCSMASILLINGAKGKRHILPNGEIMIHEVSSGSFGKVTEMADKLEHAKISNNKICKIIASKTKKPLKQVKREIKNKDTWINAETALRDGFVDKILT